MNAPPRWRNRITGAGTEDPAQLLANPRNWRTHSAGQKAALSGVLNEVGVVQNVIINQRTGYVVDGHARIELAIKERQPEIPVLYVDLSETEEALILATLDPIGAMAGRDSALLAGLLDEVATDSEGVKALLDELAGDRDGVKMRLADAFGVPPFTVLNAREGEWQNRKAAWNQLIGDGGESREETLYPDSDFMDGLPTASILDATLAEIICRWFAIPGFRTFDPFAGDTVFGFVSSYLGLPFTGIELRPEQCDINQRRCDAAGLDARYICDSAANMDAHIDFESQDLIFSCPPYADLEVYSDDPRDLSTLDHDAFFAEYAAMLGNTYAKLRPNRFAVIVTSEVRDRKTGRYIGLVPKTIAAMEAAGYSYWNELILVTAVGTLSKRAANPMNKSRKVGRTHQNVLTFFKGDVERAHANILAFYKGDPEQIRHELGEVRAPLWLFDTDPTATEEPRE